CQQHDNSPPTF
nr:immunoglobulin light chain junction region [Macaca mulatta]MOV77656.1 immunoglobulin light chain junction region [Macaca mulatta]MOV77770.1 immunoglobulin light chain junction region [Macaca mulatta]MOV78244.1 immunoglobulin light chain junction region [Macaca mulatta]MOV78395.1 immunoglobulin light chain junction region [Macaca mulatta]